MNHSTNYATRQFTIPAGGSAEMVRNANFITVLEANAPFKVSFDNGPSSDLETGLTLRTVSEFHRVELINPSAAELTVKVGLGRGDIRDARLVLSGAISSKSVSPDVLNTPLPVNCPDVAVSLLAAANAVRGEIVITNPATAGGKIYVGGDAAAVAGQGVPVDPGQTFGIATAAAIYVRNDTGAVVAVHVAETEFS